MEIEQSNSGLSLDHFPNALIGISDQCQDFMWKFQLMSIYVEILHHNNNFFRRVYGMFFNL